MGTPDERDIQVEPRQPADIPDIPFSDFSNHLAPEPVQRDGEGVKAPEWDQPSLPFRLPILAPSAGSEQPSSWSFRFAAIRGFPGRLRAPSPPLPPMLPPRRKFTGTLARILRLWCPEFICLVIPEYDIPLADILHDRHASPVCAYSL